jgi:hypothetical protein
MNTTQIGLSFEEAVLQLFRARGYDASLHQYPPTLSGARHEIDVYGTGKRKNKTFTLGVECKFKDYGALVTKSQAAVFTLKRHDCEIDEGYFASNTGYTENAAAVLDYYGIERFNGKNLNTMFKEHGIKYYCKEVSPIIDTPAARVARQAVGFIDDLGIFKTMFRERSETKRAIE